MFGKMQYGPFYTFQIVDSNSITAIMSKWYQGYVDNRWFGMFNSNRDYSETEEIPMVVVYEQIMGCDLLSKLV